MLVNELRRQLTGTKFYVCTVLYASWSFFFLP